MKYHIAIHHTKALALAAALALIFYNQSVTLMLAPRGNSDDAPTVVLPHLLQQVIAGGDRYLAADLGVFRATILTTSKLDAASTEALGQVQLENARLNPFSEDNYYIAQAILPWLGVIDPTIEIQTIASQTRHWDDLPPFFLAFDYFYFKNDVSGAIKVLDHIAIPAATSEANRVALRAMRAKWLEQGTTPERALELLTAMSAQTNDRGLKRLLSARITRVKGLIQLLGAVTRYTETYRSPPKTLEDLIQSRMIDKIPDDPFGYGFTLQNGQPLLRKHK